MQALGISDLGCVRERNEDSYCIDSALGLYVVADGMGGHLGGRVASDLAVSTVVQFLREHAIELNRQAHLSMLTAEGGESAPARSLSSEDHLTAASLRQAPQEEVGLILNLLKEAVRLACATIYQRSCEDSSLQGMGTTITALLLLGKRAFIGHVGDSRCYLQRGEHLEQLTEDHSLVNQQVKAGLLSLEEAKFSRLRNIITRSVGFEADVEVDTLFLDIAPGDIFLLCSDGLTNFVDDVEISYALKNLSLAEIPEQLIDLANSRGGDDNITVVCVHVENLGEMLPLPVTEATSSASTEAGQVPVNDAKIKESLSNLEEPLREVPKKHESSLGNAQRGLESAVQEDLAFGDSESLTPQEDD